MQINNGTVFRETGPLAVARTIWLKKRSTFKANNVIFDGQSVVLDQANFIEVFEPSDTTADPDDVDYGFTDCVFQNTKRALRLQEDTDIRGNDIIFSAYQRPPNFNSFTKSPNNPNGRYIESVFQRRNDADVWLHGNFWDNTLPPSTPVNAAWSFLRKTIPQPPAGPWLGTLHLDNTRTGDPTNASGTNCGGIALRGEVKDPFSQNTVVNVNGVLRDVRVQYDAGLRKIKDKQLKNALGLLRPLAELPQATRSTANSTVKHFVDIARAITLKTGGVTTRSSNGGWISESLVETPREIADNQLIISPNPANTAVDIALKTGNYTIHVSNALGETIFTQNTEGSLSVDVSTWTNGIYLFEVTNKATNQRQRSKIVVQH